MTDQPPTEPRRGEHSDLPDPAEETEARREHVLAALGDVWVPQLGLDVVSVGLVYDVRVDDDVVEIDLTLTTPGCPVSEQLPAEARAALRVALAEADVHVHVVWDPPWTPAQLSPVALEQLGFARWT